MRGVSFFDILRSYRIEADIQPLAGSCRNGRRLLRSPERILVIDLAVALS